MDEHGVKVSDIFYNRCWASYVVGLRKSSILLDYSIAYYVEFSLTFCLFPLLDRPSVLAFEEIDPCLKNNALLS